MKLALLALLFISRTYHPVSISDLAADDPHQPGHHFWEQHPVEEYC